MAPSPTCPWRLTHATPDKVTGKWCVSARSVCADTLRSTTGTGTEYRLVVPPTREDWAWSLEYCTSTLLYIPWALGCGAKHELSARTSAARTSRGPDVIPNLPRAALSVIPAWHSVVRV